LAVVPPIAPIEVTSEVGIVSSATGMTLAIDGFNHVSNGSTQDRDSDRVGLRSGV
jgi:hypothetical protein